MANKSALRTLADLRYIPLLFAVAPQAYAVYLWLLPHPYDMYGEFFAIMGGVGYEFIYVGAIAWAVDGQWSMWTWATAFCALIFSMLVAYHVYEDQGQWAWLHSGFPMVAFTYTMHLHSGVTSQTHLAVERVRRSRRSLADWVILSAAHAIDAYTSLAHRIKWLKVPALWQIAPSDPRVTLLRLITAEDAADLVSGLTADQV